MKVYVKKGRFDNEPFCPSCGNELVPLRNAEGVQYIVGCLDCRPCYCLKEKKLFLVNKIWFGVKVAGVDWERNFEIVPVPEAKKESEQK